MFARFGSTVSTAPPATPRTATSSRPPKAPAFERRPAQRDLHEGEEADRGVEGRKEPQQRRPRQLPAGLLLHQVIEEGTAEARQRNERRQLQEITPGVRAARPAAHGAWRLRVRGPPGEVFDDEQRADQLEPGEQGQGSADPEPGARALGDQPSQSPAQRAADEYSTQLQARRSRIEVFSQRGPEATHEHCAQHAHLQIEQERRKSW